MLRRQTLSLLLICYTILVVQSMKLCLVKSQQEVNRPPYQIHQEEQLRSYKPHFLNSFSYPKKVSTLIYYGQVIDSKPIFFVKDHQQSEKKAEQVFLINGVESTPFSAQTYLLRKQIHDINRFMLVVQVQNLDPVLQLNSTIYVYEKQNYYLFVVEYENQFKAYQLFFVNGGNKIQQLKQVKTSGLSIFLHNQSATSNFLTWQLAQQLRWKGQLSTVNLTSEQSKFPGVVLQMQFTSKQMLQQTKIHLKQIKRKHNMQTKEQFLERVGNKIQQVQKVIKAKKKQTCAQAAVSKLLGGLTYQYGTLQLRNGSQVLFNQPKQLLSFSPSRTRFPWGFLWDDGFHCQVVVRHDQELVVKVIKSWLDTIDQSGWIPRQQNRGKQRENLCNCPRFMPKDIRDGNPPTLILALDYLQRKNKLNPKVFPIQYWQKVKMWYNWFLKTLQTQQMLFKWQDSVNNKGASFTSGLDDFPRPHNSKGHIDLQSWIYFFSRFMSQAAPLYAESNSPYLKNLQKIKVLFHSFQDPSDHILKDFQSSTSFSPHIGYPSILPIAFGILQESSVVFSQTMKMIKEQLDTGYGLSSISMKDKLYLENRDAYWKGPVWININYLLLKGLKIYYQSQHQYYHKLRQDILSTVCGNYDKTGYFYQNYIHGKGSFSYPFNGWTSLIALIEGENY